MWEVVQRWFDDNIKKLGVQNAYFPMFITEDVLNTEKDHVEGFAPEVGVSWRQVRLCIDCAVGCDAVICVMKGPGVLRD